jgi:FAD:protein FMN transferase
MGGGAHLLVRARTPQAARSALDAGARRLRSLERRWSRFRPESEVCRLGRAEGAATPVHPDTRLLVSWCVTAWQRSAGRFDPTVVDALENLGYRQTFDRVLELPEAGLRPIRPPSAAAGCAGVTVDDEAGTVTLPPGVRLDPGGIGKGLAADLASAAMLAAGAEGACVNVAGDVRARGDGPDCPPDVGPAGGPGRLRGGWVIGVEHPLDAGRALATVRLPPGGGAVVAAEGAWADAATKIALVGPEPDRAVHLLERLDVAALLVLDDGTVLATGPFRRDHRATE